MTQNKQYLEQHNNLGECGPCPILASYTLAFALQLRKKHGKTSSNTLYTTSSYFFHMLIYCWVQGTESLGS